MAKTYRPYVPEQDPLFGANAVMIGRPYIWGWAAFGQQGVEAVLDMFC